jgi:hypothetical protein
LARLSGKRRACPRQRTIYLFLREHCRRGSPGRPIFAIVGTLQLIYARILCLCGLASVRTPATALSSVAYAPEPIMLQT